jgi:hypothetical protein
MNYPLTTRSQYPDAWDRDVFRTLKLRLSKWFRWSTEYCYDFCYRRFLHNFTLPCALIFIEVTFIKFSCMCTIHRDQGFHFMKLHKPVVSAEMGKPFRFCKHFCKVIIWKSPMSKFHCLSVSFLWFREPPDTVTVWQAPSHEAGTFWICEQLYVPFLHCLLSGNGAAKVCKYSLQWNSQITHSNISVT